MDTLERLQIILKEELGLDDPPALEATLADLGADSLDRLNLTIAIEDEFEIDIPDEDGQKMTTVQSILVYVESKMPKGKSANG
jgi:acyl carrier protein